MEAMLTGESVAAYKNLVTTPADFPLGDRHCMAFAGTLCTAGQGLGVAVSIGDAAGEGARGVH